MLVRPGCSELCSVDINLECAQTRFFTVCSFNEKANSRKLFASPGSPSTLVGSHSLFLMKKIFQKKSFLCKHTKNLSFNLNQSDDLWMSIAQPAFANIWE